MSYDVAVEIDTGGPEPLHIEPSFNDQHPALASDGIAGTVVMRGGGYWRCGNYTSNVSPMWMMCLSSVMGEVPGSEQWAGVDDRRMLERNGPTIHYLDGSKGRREVRTDQICLRDLAGASCSDLTPLLAAAVEWGIAHLDELRELNPENGWGNAEGAVTYLWDIQRLCEAHPKASLYLSC